MTPLLVSPVALVPDTKILKSQAVDDIRPLSKIDIIDIRRSAVEINLKEDILTSLKPKNGPKTMPTLLLYNERGLKLFEQITYLPEYYLTNAEIDILEKNAQSIASSIPDDAAIIELGSGNLRKVCILLQALEDAGRDIDYYALDLSVKELKRTLEQIPHFNFVRCHGLHGTYDDGLEWLKINGIKARPKCIMSLGSSIGNFSRHEAAAFLRSFTNDFGPNDTMLLGVDSTQDAAKVYHAYNDREGLTHEFVLNGLVQANEILGTEAFDLDDWKVIGEYVYDSEGGRHQAFYSPVRDVSFKDIHFRAQERIKVEESLKFSSDNLSLLWQCAGVNEVKAWTASSESYGLHLLAKQTIEFSSHPQVYAAGNIPKFSDWKELWAVWDKVTREMVSSEELHEKPIKLRNACIFYLGHIPTFLDIQITKVTGLPPCEPSYYPQIFERGIDPDVDNPEQCHAHSEIPDEWPPLQEILGYQRNVRTRIESIYERQEIPRSLGRALWIGLEHEIMHLETLLYMLLQSNKTLPPTTFIPDFASLARLARSARVPNEWFKVPGQNVILGLNDPEDNSGPDSPFGWDNEKPVRQVFVPEFSAQARPITNEDFARYLEQTNIRKLPASWTQTTRSTDLNCNGTNGHTKHDESVSETYLDGKAVRTMYGLVPLKYALDWPVFASYDELAGCASWLGGRIPTVEEARSIYSYVDGLKTKEAEQHCGKKVPAVNGHLVNDGVEETPPQRALKVDEGSRELFVDLVGANVGFKNWHPVAVTSNGNKLAGQSEMGGVWEWTSSPLEKHEGFEPMKLYPAYTADFFDGKHNIVLGGSWATHPRIAGRKSFVNWYQRNYPYAWAGARLVRDH